MIYGWLGVCGFLIVSKLLGYLTLSWWWVLAPVYVPVLFGALLATLLGSTKN